jgi:hypothetical protein
MTAAAYFATAFLGQKLKLKISSEKRLIISQRLFGIPLHFHFSALADGIRNIPSYSSPNPPDDALKNSQLELLPGGEGQKMRKVHECLFLTPREVMC